MDYKKYRIEVLRKCQSCFDKKILVGQAFREYECKFCVVKTMHPNTGVPTLCPKCSKEHDLCSYCLKPMD